jgi:hypothetical protein
MKPSLGVVPASWVRVDILWPVFGITANAANNYRRSGAWTEGTHFKKDPANRYIFNIPRIEEWLES